MNVFEKTDKLLTEYFEHCNKAKKIKEELKKLEPELREAAPESLRYEQLLVVIE